MKPRRIFSAARLTLPFASALVALLAAQASFAATLTWDTAAGDAGAITDGSGIWSDMFGNWNNGSGDVNWANATPDNAIFGGGTAGTFGTVTLGSAITAGSLTFNTPNGGGAYTIDTSTFGLTLNTGITANESATIQNGIGGSIILGAANTWSVAGTKILSVSSPISGGFGITKTGAGTLTLSGANTFTGMTTISAGTIRLQNTGALASTSSISMTGTSSLVFATDTAFTTLPGLSGSSGAFTYTLVSDRATTGAGLTHALGTTNMGNAAFAFESGSNVTGGTAGISFTGATLSGGSAGTVTLRPNTSTFTIGTIAAGGTGAKVLALDGTGTGSITGAITPGSVGLSVTKSNSGTWILSGANTFAGGLTLNAGTLRATTNAGALGAGTLTLAGGTLQLANNTGLNFGRNTTVTGNSTVTSDRLATGAGVTHTLGTLSIGARTLSITRGANATSGTGGITFGATTLTAGPAVFDTGANTNLTLGAVGGAFALTKQGNGQLTLGTTSTRTTAAGITNLSAGTLRLTTASALNTLATAPLNISGGTLSLGNNTGTTFTGAATTISGNAAIISDRTSGGAGVTHALGTLSIGAQTLTISRGTNATSGTGGITFGNASLTGAATFTTNANSLLTLSGTTGLGTNTLTKTGAGSMTLTGVVSGTKAAGSNAISVTGGLLTASNAGNTFSGDIAVSGAGSVFAMAGGTFTTAAPYGRAGGTLYKQLLLTNGGAYRLTGGSFNNNAPDATNTAEGIIFNIGTGGGTLDIASGATLTIDDGSGAGTGVGNSQLQGSGTLTKTSNGTLSLGAGSSNFSAFTGAITVSAGTLQLGNAGSPLGNTTNGTTIQSGARLNVNGTTQTAAEPLSISGTGLASAPAGALTNASGTAATWVGPVTLGGAATIGSSAAGGLTLSSTATVNTAGNTLTIATSGTGRIFTDGVISGLGSVVINNTSTGDYVPRADHTYSGGTTLTAGLVAVDRDSIGTPGSPTSGPFGTGTLTIAGGQMRSGTGSNRTVGNAVTLSGNATFFTVAGEKNLTFTGPVTLSGGDRILTSNVGTTVAGTSTIFTGAIGDGGSGLGLTKAGLGNLTLGGANTYTGVTGSTGGNLFVTGSLANNSGLSIAPADASGAVISFVNNAANTPANFNSLTLGSALGTSFLGLDLGTASDSIVTSAAATTGNNISFHLNAASGFGAGNYSLISAASGLTAGGATYSLGNAPGGYTYALNSTDTLVELTATAATAGSRYWRGNLSNSWSAFSGLSTTNWATDAAGTTVSTSAPGAGDTVFFSATNATGPAITTTLDGNFTVNDLQFLSAPTGVTNVTINPGLIPGSLTIAPSSSATGLTLAQGAGAVAIAAPITLGAAQTWSVDSSTPGAGTASSLTVSGAISGLAANGLTFTSTAGTAPIILSATGSTYSGGSTVSASTIVQGGATNGFSPNTAWTVDGTLNTGAFSQATGSLAGGSGIVQNSSVTNAVLTIGSDNLSSATFAGTIQNGSTGTLGLTKTGTGTQILSGTNTYTGATVVNGGTLKAGSTSALGVGSALTVTSPGTLDLGGNNITVASLAASTGTITDSSTPGSGGILQITGSTATAIAATVTGSAGFQYQNNNGANALFSNTANTYSGGTYLGIGTNRARYTLGAVTVGNGVGVGLTAGIFGTGAIHMGRATTDQGQIYVTGAGTINNPITYNSILGSDVVGGIRLQNTTNTATFNGVQTAGLSAISIGAYGSTGTLALTGRLTGSGTFSGTISNLNGNLGAGNIIATNAGLIIGASNNNIATVILNNAAANNNYTGDTYVTAQGILRTDAANQLPSGTGTGNLYVTGTVNMQGFSQATGLLSGAGNIDGISGTPTLTIGGNNATGLNFSGIIRNTAGTLSLTKTGSGTQTLSGANTYSGATSITGGTLAFSAANNLGDGSASNTITVNGATLSYTGSTGINLTANQAITVGAGGGTLDVTSAAGTLAVGTVTSSGGNLVKTGAGTVSIGGTTNLSGTGVVVNGGKLQAGFGTNGVGAITVDSSGSLSFQNSTIESLTLASSGTVLTLNNGARLGFELDGATNDSITVPTGGGLAVAAGGYTFDFFGLNAGVTATTYTLLTAPAGSNLGSYTYNLGDAPLGFNYTFLTSDTMVQLQTVAYTPIYWNNTQADGSWANVTGNNGSIGAGAGTNFTSDSAGTTDAGHAPLATETVIFNTSAIAGGPTLSTTLDGSRTIDSLQFNGANSVTSVTIAEGSGGTLTLKPASASGGIAILTGGGNATISAPLTLDNTLSTNQAWNVTDAGSTLELSGNVAFGANVNKSGAGAVTLSGANSGAGNFNLNAGTLNLNSAGALGTGDLNIAAGTTLNNSSGGAVTLSANGAVNVNGDFTFTGTQSLNLGTGAVTLSGNPIVTVAANTLTLGGVVGGTSNLTKAGAGTMVLDANNTYTGVTTISGGVLRITKDSGLGTTASGTTQSGTSALELDGTGGAITVGTEALTINGGGITNLGALRNIAGNNTYGGTVTLAAQSRINSDSGTLTLNNATAVSATNLTLVVGGAGNTTISGAIATGTGGVSKDGTGILTLSGTNTYTGDTNVNTGTLNLTGSLTGNGTTNAGSSLLYGTTAGNSVVNVSGNIVNYRRFQGATNASANAAYIQTAGNVNFTSTETTNPTNTVAAAGYGYMQITGGTLTAKGRFAPSNGAATTGVMYIGGSGTLDHTGGEWLLMSYSPSGDGGRSMITVDTGGTLNRVGSSNQFGLNMDRSNGYAVLNIAGGEVLNSNRAITFGNGTSANITGTTGMLNLAAGTLQIGTNMLNGNTGAGSTGNNAYLNFAGGTLKAQAALTGAIPLGGANQTFTSTIYGAIDNVGTGHDFAGGLTVDTNTFSTTLANPLVAPSNDGVAQTSLTVNGGTGYIGAPMVQFTGGTLAPGGAPAAGYAVVSNGVVTEIVITSPGSYTAAPTVTLTGGGGTGASVAVGTLVSNTSGGLTKIGNGTLVLSSAASSFAGPVTISGGTLQGSGVGTLANIGANSALGTGDATSTATNAASLVLDGGTYSIINTNASVATDRLFTVTEDGGTVSFDNGTAAFVVNFNNTNAIAYTGSGARTLTFTGANASTIGVPNTFAPLIGNAGGDQVSLTKSGATALVLTNTGNTYTGGTNIQQGILGFASGALGTTGNITFTGNSTLLWATGNTDDISSRLVMTNAVTSTLDTNGNNVTFASDIGSGSSGVLTKNGNGILTLNGSNTYSGGTNLNAGGLAINSATAIGSGPLSVVNAAIDNTTASPITLSTNNTQTWANNGALAFTGTRALNLGTGAVTLGTNATAGGFTLTNNSTLPGTSLTIGGDISAIAGGTAGVKTLTIAGPGSTALTGNITKGAASNVVVTVTSGGTTTLSGAANSIQTINLNGGASSILELGAGNLTITNAGTNGFRSSTGGTINATGGGSIILGSNLLDNGTADGTTLTVNSGITGPFTFEIYGGATTNTGVTVLTAQNTFTGDVHINGGNLSVSNIGNTGSTTSNLGSGTLIQSGAAVLAGSTVNTGKLIYTGTGETTNRILTMSGAGFAIEQSGASGNLLFSSDVSVTSAAAKTLFLLGSTAGTGEISGVIPNNTAATSITKLGTGKWTLSGLSDTAASNYTGTTTINEGTLAITHATTAALTGGLTFGATAANTTVSTLDLTGGSATFTGAALVQTNSTSANTINIGATKTLTFNGGLTIGYVATAGSPTNTLLTASGGGEMAVNGTTLSIGQDSGTPVNSAWVNNGVLDVTGLSNFTTNLTNINLGVGTNGAGEGDLLLSNTANTLVATTITVGNTGGNNGSGTSSITLGTGTNDIQADTINIGIGKGSGPGVVQFASQTTGSPGTVTIADKAGTGAANITVANVNGVGTGGGAIGTLDLRGHVATVNAGTLLISNANNGTGTNSSGTNGTVSFDAGTFTVATLNMGIKTGASTGTAAATLNVGGGNFTVNTAFTLGSQATGGASAATLNLTGGTFTSNVDIVAGTGTTNSTITLNGGTLDMTGKNIGGATAVDNLNLQSGTLKNVAEINNGGAISKTTTGTLIMEGTNTYTGATTVSAGTLLVNNTTGSGTGSGTVTVDGGTLGGTGTISGDVSVNVTGVLSPGASIETLATGALSLNTGSTLAHELDSSALTSVGSDLLKVTGNLSLAGTVGLTLADIAGTPVAFNVNDTFSLINYTGTWNGGKFTFASNELDDEEVFTFGLNDWKISYNDTAGGSNYATEHVTGSFVNLTVVPEPSSVALLGVLGSMLLLRRRR